MERWGDGVCFSHWSCWRLSGSLSPATGRDRIVAPAGLTSCLSLTSRLGAHPSHACQCSLHTGRALRMLARTQPRARRGSQRPALPLGQGSLALKPRSDVPREAQLRRQRWAWPRSSRTRAGLGLFPPQLRAVLRKPLPKPGGCSRKRDSPPLWTASVPASPASCTPCAGRSPVSPAGKTPQEASFPFPEGSRSVPARARLPSHDFQLRGLSATSGQRDMSTAGGRVARMARVPGSACLCTGCTPAAAGLPRGASALHPP